MRRITDPSAVSLKRRLVDRAVGCEESLVGDIEVAARGVTVQLRPALVLGLENPAGLVAQAHQGGEPLAGHRAVGPEGRSTISDRMRLSAFELVDRAIVADEEAALGDMLLGWRRCERRRGRGRPVRFGPGDLGFGKPPDGRAAAARPGRRWRRRCNRFAVERVLAAPFPQHHVRVVQEVAVHRDLGAVDRKRRRVQPVRVGVASGFPGGTFTQEHDVGDDRGALALEGIRWQADRAEEVRLAGEFLACRRVLLVEGVMAGDQGEDAAGFQGVERLGDEEIVQRQLAAAELEPHVGERRVADHGVDASLGQAECRGRTRCGCRRPDAARGRCAPTRYPARRR